MELDKTRALIMMLRELNVTTYKDGQLELVLGAAPTTKVMVGEEDIQTEETSAVDKDLDSLAPGYRALFTVEAK